MTRDRWWDLGFAGLLCIFTFLLYKLISELNRTVSVKDMALTLVACASLFVSVVTFYLTVLRPYIMRPRLTCSIDMPPKSEPTNSEAQSGVKASTFLRLKIENQGGSVAKQCVGRLLEVQDEHHHRLDIDTLYFYWARQSDPDAFEKVDIQGYGDSFDLDVVQADENTNKIALRVVIPTGHRLVKSQQFSDKAELAQGIYYLKIAIWADGAYIKPMWFRVKWENSGAPLLEKV